MRHIRFTIGLLDAIYTDTITAVLRHCITRGYLRRG